MLKIRELRLARELTQKELAEKCNLSNKSIWAYENSIAVPPLDILIKLADFFECSIDYLVAREDDFGNIFLKTDAPNLSQEEKEIITTFRALPQELQVQVESYVSTLGNLVAEEKKYKFQRK